MKRTLNQMKQASEWFGALQAGANEHRERINQNLAKGREWSDERRAAWKEKAKMSWTPAMREAARQRALKRHADKKAAQDEA